MANMLPAPLVLLASRYGCPDRMASSRAFQLGMRSRWAHNIEDRVLSIGWCPVLVPVVQALADCGKVASVGPRPLYLFMATLPCDILSASWCFVTA